METKAKPVFDKRIFWDVVFENIDYDAKANFVIERVFERGDVPDIRNCRRYYGDEKVTAALLNAKFLPETTMYLASAVTHRPLIDFRCYRLRQSNPHTFSILEELLAMDELQGFSLVGGTALSLLYGHRKSEDLDLFCNTTFDNQTVVAALEKKFKQSFVNRSTNPRFGIFGFIEEVKIDLIRHPHPLIRPLQTTGDIRMFSTEDIIAMKVQAVLGRGKKKDFWDIAELLQHYTVPDFVQLHKEKYTTQNLLITVPQAITYFADAEESEDPISLKGQNWKSVKAAISKKVDAHLK